MNCAAGRTAPERTMIERTVTVNDKMQRRYRYRLTAPSGRNFDPEFRPQLTPPQMLRLGVFGGKYLTDCQEEFPKSWFKGAKLASDGRDRSLNFFGVDASQPLSVWRAKGWIHPDDPRGWFQWYCRYYRGRRLPQEDRRQIGRWKAIPAMSGRSSGTASRASSPAANVNARPCCTGPMTAERSDHAIRRHPRVCGDRGPESGGERRDHARAAAAGQGRARHRQDRAGDRDRQGRRCAVDRVARQIDHQSATGALRI